MRPRLLVISGSQTGTVRPLIDGHISIGLDASDELCAAGSAVWRRQCTIDEVDGQFEIVDPGSHNGTFVNGIPVRHKVIVHGDRIRVGKSELVFLVHDDEKSGTARILLSDAAAIATIRTVPVADASSATFADRVGHMARDLAALLRISGIINSIRDRELLQRELLQLIFEVIPAESGAVVLLHDLDEDPSSIVIWNRQPENRQPGVEKPLEIQRELVHRAIWEHSAIFTGSLAGASDVHNALCMPLVAVEKTLGVIYLTSRRPAPPFREDHIHFLEPVSRIAAVTLENILALDGLRSENQQLKAELNPAGRIVGGSRQIRQVEEFISRVAKSESTVLIRGESGTGKEVVARAIHQKSPRCDRPFVAINCAAIPETLFESELFGYEKGAFTGAAGMRKGKLEAAGDGTVFLDEIGELPSPMQAKLLRVLQQKEFERVGGTHTIPFKARVLAATNKNLEQAIKAGEFRQDLYYRLNVVSVHVPPLREHREDISLLALYFAAKYAEKSKRPFKGISLEARRLLVGYSWPGNVRELENAIEHAIVLGLTEEILPEDLPEGMLEEQSAALTGAGYHAAVNEARKGLIRNALGEAKGSVAEAARLLGIHPKYLHRLVRNLNLKTELN
ncbi:MAG: sigma 54-interacting transcriptional regulator [Terracidiphilus sp.]